MQVVEDVTHFIFDSPMYTRHRQRMLQAVRQTLSNPRARCPLSANAFDAISTADQAEVLLGQRIGAPLAEDKIDRHVKCCSV